MAKKTEVTTKYVYQVILVDPIWDNWEHLGFFTDIAQASRSVTPAIIQTLCDASLNGLELIKEDGTRLTPEGPLPYSYEDWESLFMELVVVPDNFLNVYPSTFCECIDRPWVSVEDLVGECLPPEISMEPYYGEECLCIRGFVFEMPVDIADGLSK